MHMPKKSWVMPQLLKQIKIVKSFNFISLEIHLIHPPNLKTQLRILWRDSKVPGYLRVAPHERTWKSYLRVLCNFLSCVQVGTVQRTRFVSSKDNGSLGRGNGWSLVLAWFMSDTVIRKTTIKPSFEVRQRSTVLEKMLYYTPCIPTSFSPYIYRDIKNIW